MPIITFKNTRIECVKDLNILGVTFDSKLTFKSHCLKLRNKLVERLNVIKFLSSRRSFIHTNTLVNATKSLILSKVDHGLPIYGWCAKTNLKALNKPYNTAVRRAIGAFPTSPLKCVFAESGIPEINDRVIEATHKLLPKLFNAENKILHSVFVQALRQKRSYKIKSTIRRCSNIARNLDLSNARLSNPKANPPWLFNEDSVITDLSNGKKLETSSKVYEKAFAEKMDYLKDMNYTPIFTDGSKTNSSTSFAVVKENGDLISNALLPPYFSVFTAELLAIKSAITFAQQNKGNFVICSDSLSVINAIKNISNESESIAYIRNILTKSKNKIKVLWVPGHAGIRGNELADTAARNATNLTTLTYYPPEKKDVKKLIAQKLSEEKSINWVRFSHPYTRHNRTGQGIKFPAKCSRAKATMFTRLRIGHTEATHNHLLLNTPPPTCNTCNSPLTVEHILNNCQALNIPRQRHFGDTKPTDALKEVCAKNIEQMYDFLIECKLINNI